MKRLALPLVVAVVVACASAAHAASGTIEYSCTSAAAQQSLDSASVQGHSALFYYRLRKAVEAGECKISNPASAAAPAPKAQAYNPPPKPRRVRTADRNGFPPPWLFKPLR